MLEAIRAGSAGADVRRRHRCGTLVALAVAAGLLAVPGSALAVTRIGPTLNQPSTTFLTPNQTYAQQTLPGVTLAAPRNGVIVRWSVRNGPSPRPSARLRVLGPALGGAFAGLRSGPVRGLSRNNTVQSFATRLPIAAGQRIGLDITGSRARIRRPGGVAILFNPPLADGETRARTRVLGGARLQLNAEIEGDIDGDGYGDETQDRCPTDGARQGGCGEPTLQSFRISPRRFRRSALVSYVLNQPANVRLTVRQARGAKRFRGSLTRRSTPGANRLRVRRRFAGRRLSRGLYRLTATATNAGGQRSPTVRRYFRVR